MFEVRGSARPERVAREELWVMTAAAAVAAAALPVPTVVILV